ncbi:MAG: branched-chain amino acid ABC transporter permease [Burkholderiaceae bacterium]|nr:branched-chain amino acid ABC transporter permease [Burkholderiaceae bacterium]
MSSAVPRDKAKVAAASIAAERRTPTVVLAAGLLAAAGFAVPWVVGSQLALTLMTQAVIHAILATSIGFMIRQNGLTSFGHAAFFGMAAYLMALNGKLDAMPAELAVLAAIAVPAAFAFFAGLIIVRLPALSFSMLTLAVAQSLYELMLRWRGLAGGDDGMAVRLPARLFGIDIELFQAPSSMFVVSWCALVAVIAILTLVARSHFGVLTVAIRENEERARYVGYHTLVPRALVFALSAAVGGLAGVLFALYNAFVTPGALHWSLSGEALIMAVIGGPQAIWGPALGAVIFFVVKNAMGDLTEHWPAIIGAMLIVVTVLLPQGISGLLNRLNRLNRRSREARKA